MKRKVFFLLLGLLIMTALAACGQDSQGSVDIAQNGDGDETAAIGTSASDNAAEEIETLLVQINDDFAGALSPMGQLALGTLQLDNSQLAVTAEQAAELLPLWQALQSLSNSETTAQVELDAVVKQIQGAMTAGQVATIAKMKLTEDDLTEMVGSGQLDFRGLGGRNAAVEGEDGAMRPPAGFGGGPGGGLGRPGGGPGGLGGELGEDDIATRRAEFSKNGLGDVSERFLTTAVVRLMQTKTGDAPADPGRLFDTVFEVVAEQTDLSVEAIQSALAEGQVLAEIIESNGGDVEVVRSALIEIFEALPGAEAFDAEERADLWLNPQSGQE